MVQAFEIGRFVCSLDCRNKGIGVDRVLRNGDRSCVGELGECGGRIVGVTARSGLGGEEGRTVVFCQRYTVLDAQWQIRLRGTVRTWSTTDQ